ncbi:MAG: histidine phosphatase family protein [Phycisphaerae bacterium]
MAKRLLLVRHASTGPEYAGRYVGSTDVPLSAEGLRQAEGLASLVRRSKKYTPLRSRLLKGDQPCMSILRIITSPLRRARQTGETLAGVVPVEVDADLREIDFGKWEGRTFDQIAVSDPQLVDRWANYDSEFAFPGGESTQHFLERVHRVADRMAADPAENVLAVTHGGVIRAIICYLLGLPSRNYLLFDVKPASLTTIELIDGKGVLTGLNDLCHLEGLEDG